MCVCVCVCIGLIELDSSSGTFVSNIVESGYPLLFPSVIEKEFNFPHLGRMLGMKFSLLLLFWVKEYVLSQIEGVAFCYWLGESFLFNCLLLNRNRFRILTRLI